MYINNCKRETKIVYISSSRYVPYDMHHQQQRHLPSEDQPTSFSEQNQHQPHQENHQHQQTGFSQQQQHVNQNQNHHTGFTQPNQLPETGFTQQVLAKFPEQLIPKVVIKLKCPFCDSTYPSHNDFYVHLCDTHFKEKLLQDISLIPPYHCPGLTKMFHNILILIGKSSLCKNFSH